MRTPSTPFRLNARTLNITRAIAALCVAAPCFAQSQAPVTLGTVSVTGKVPVTLEPTESAPSQGSLEARSAASVVSDMYIRNFTAPTADYQQILTTTPGAFAYSPNGVGLGDATASVRGLGTSYLGFSFDGIPFTDTNSISHHAWSWFPSQFLGGAVVDRSPGSASVIGQAAFTGNVYLSSRTLEQERRARVGVSFGTWNTKQQSFEYETGQFGADGSNNMLMTVQQTKSDGYQTGNNQEKIALSAKYQKALTRDTTLTLFASYIDLQNNTPNTKGVSRSNYNAGTYNYLLQTSDPTKGDYKAYNFYDVPTNFNYAGITSRLDGGWVLDDKVYSYAYHNKQNYVNYKISAANVADSVTTTNAVDKLNAYVTMGNILKLTRESSLGTLRTGLWLEKSDSRRFQIPSDARTWVDTPAPNFFETYTTTTFQPYIEHEFKVSDVLKVTPGLKYASYKQDFVHMQDLGSGVGQLGGTLNAAKTAITGGAASVSNSITYSDWLPSIDVHYKLQPNWSVYGQYAVGNQIPPTSVFDVPNAKVSTPPKALKAKTVQFGSVFNGKEVTVAADVYHTTLDNSYTSLLDSATGNTVYNASGTQVAQGIEAEANFALGQGFSLYANGTLGSVKYTSTGLWVNGAPKDTETLALNYRRDGWAVSLSANRVGSMYNDGKNAAGTATVNQAFSLDPVILTNLFVNYTVKNLTGFDKQTRFQFGVNNLMNKHSVVGIASAANGSTSANPSLSDQLTVLPARSLSFTATMDF